MLALLLREPTTRVVVYVVLVGTFFTALLRRAKLVSQDDVSRHRFAYGVVALLCLALTCFIGIFTRRP